jgi:hypothetical protein
VTASAARLGDEPQPDQGVRVTKIRASEPIQRPPHPWIHPCPTCGKPFWTKPWKGRPATYCSDACRQAAYRERLRHRLDERPRPARRRRS